MVFIALCMRELYNFKNIVIQSHYSGFLVSSAKATIVAFRSQGLKEELAWAADKQLRLLVLRSYMLFKKQLYWQVKIFGDLL